MKKKKKKNASDDKELRLVPELPVIPAPGLTPPGVLVSHSEAEVLPVPQPDSKDLLLWCEEHQL